MPENSAAVVGGRWPVAFDEYHRRDRLIRVKVRLRSLRQNGY